MSRARYEFVARHQLSSVLLCVDADFSLSLFQPATASASEEKNTSSAASSSSSSAKIFTLEDVAKHNKKDDVWVVVNGQVLDVTSFLPDHPGGEKAILLYAGRDATEEFNMLHDPKVIPRYAADSVIGDLKK